MESTRKCLYTANTTHLFYTYKNLFTKLQISVQMYLKIKKILFLKNTIYMKHYWLYKGLVWCRFVEKACIGQKVNFKKMPSLWQGRHKLVYMNETRRVCLKTKAKNSPRRKALSLKKKKPSAFFPPIEWKQKNVKAAFTTLKQSWHGELLWNAILSTFSTFWLYTEVSGTSETPQTHRGQVTTSAFQRRKKKKKKRHFNTSRRIWNCWDWYQIIMLLLMLCMHSAWKYSSNKNEMNEQSIHRRWKNGMHCGIILEQLYMDEHIFSPW